VLQYSQLLFDGLLGNTTTMQVTIKVTSNYFRKTKASEFN